MKNVKKKIKSTDCKLTDNSRMWKISFFYCNDKATIVLYKEMKKPLLFMDLNEYIDPV